MSTDTTTKPTTNKQRTKQRTRTVVKPADPRVLNERIAVNKLVPVAVTYAARRIVVMARDKAHAITVAKEAMKQEYGVTFGHLPKSTVILKGTPMPNTAEWKPSA